jgi:serine/threonine-protein kinase HipA
MTKTLDVYLYNFHVGELIQTDNGVMQFKYIAEWLSNPRAQPLSYSLPLREQIFNGEECKGFFAGILPEENKRRIIARNLGISAYNDFSMLERIGEECAGAVMFLPHGTLPKNHAHDYLALSDQELAKLLRILPSRPLLAGGENDVRLSLAGAQDKMAVTLLDNQIHLPLQGAPSTHIIKPAIEPFKDIVYNEALCLQLANAVGIPAATVEIRKAEDILFLLVKRYDREINQQGQLQRVHQEDFCQALNFPPEMKYQNEGGPSLKHCFSLLRSLSTFPLLDIKTLLDAVIFNYLIGNCDAHSKNFSLLYLPAEIGSQVRLAPLYDLICTLAYPDLSKKMAMRIGKQYAIDMIFKRDWERFAEEAGFSMPSLKERILILAGEVSSKLSEIAKNYPCTEVVEHIQQQCVEASQRLE